jgi:hypothetical protein
VVAALFGWPAPAAPPPWVARVTAPVQRVCFRRSTAGTKRAWAVLVLGVLGGGGYVSCGVHCGAYQGHSRPAWPNASRVRVSPAYLAKVSLTLGDPRSPSAARSRSQVAGAGIGRQKAETLKLAGLDLLWLLVDAGMARTRKFVFCGPGTIAGPRASFPRNTPPRTKSMRPGPAGPGLCATFGR